MVNSVKKNLVVAGGNGFLGSRICKSAVARGWDVTSLRYVDTAAPMAGDHGLTRFTKAVLVSLRGQL